MGQIIKRVLILMGCTIVYLWVILYGAILGFTYWDYVQTLPGIIIAAICPTYLVLMFSFALSGLLSIIFLINVLFPDGRKL